MQNTEQLISAARQKVREANWPQAQALYRQIIAMQPGNAEAIDELGYVHCMAGNLREGLAAFDLALKINPNFARAWANRGNALRLLGDSRQALAAYRKAASISPDDPMITRNLAAMLLESGNTDDAVTGYRKTLSLNPDDAGVHNELGMALAALGKIAESIVSFQKAIRLNPRLSSAHSNLAGALGKENRTDEALAASQRAVELDPNSAPAHCNLAQALWLSGNIEKSLESARRAVELEPDKPFFWSNYLFSIHFQPECSPSQIRREHENWNAQIAAPIIRGNSRCENDRSPRRALRIGYLSTNFRSHAQAAFILPLLEHHDRAQFETICYADNSLSDIVTEKLRRCAQVWRQTRAMSDEDLARQIREDRIDILVDLTMHMPGNRLLTLARKPAPIQIAYLAYPGTTGLATMDYRITDPHLDPPGEHESHFTEALLRLPRSFACYDPAGLATSADEHFPEPLDTPPLATSGFVTFGSMNNLSKINRKVLALWARVLKVVPASRLRMLAASEAGRRHVADLLSRHGVDPARIDFVPTQKRAAYFAEFQRIDVMLDTLPYSGHTTGLDALWSGVPVVTRIGDASAGRAIWSVLNNLGLPEFAAADDDQFVQIATKLAADPPRLTNLRRSLRRRLEASPIMDGSAFMRDLESAYRTIWQEWCEKAT